MVNFVSALYAFAGVNNSASIVIHFAIGGRGLVNPSHLDPCGMFSEIGGLKVLLYLSLFHMGIILPRIFSH